MVEIVLAQVWPSIDDNDPPPGVEQQLAAVAVATLAALPHVVAFLGFRGRPWLLKAAGVICIAFTLVSGISFFLLAAAIPLFLIPGVVYLVVKRPALYEQGISTGFILVLAIIFGVAAAGSFLLTQDPRCTIEVRRAGEVVYETPQQCDAFSTGRLGPEVISWSGSSDSIAWHESLLSMMLSGALILVSLRSGRGDLNVTG